MRFAFRFAGFLAVVALGLSTARTTARTSDQTATRSPFDALHFRDIGPAATGGRIHDLADRSEESRRALRRRGDGRHLEVDEQGRDLEGHLRPAAGQHVRRARDLRGRSEDHLGRHRRAEQPPELVVGRRRVSLDRRRRDVDVPRPARHALDRPRRARPDRSERRVRRRRRQSVGRQSRARRLQDDRRRPHVDQGALRRHVHRRDRPRDGSARSERALRGDVSAPAQGVRLQRRRTRAARSTRRPTPARRGRSSRTAFPPATRAASASRSRCRSPTCSSRPSSTRRRAAPIAPRTPARRGSG